MGTAISRTRIHVHLSLRSEQGENQILQLKQNSSINLPFHFNDLLLLK